MQQYSTLSGRCVSQNQASGNGPPGDGWMDGREEIFHGSFAPCDDTVLLQLSSYREQSTLLPSLRWRRCSRVNNWINQAKASFFLKRTGKSFQRRRAESSDSDHWLCSYTSLFSGWSGA